jgi:type III secretion system FlhB-like substrate exporter
MSPSISAPGTLIIGIALACGCAAATVPSARVASSAAAIRTAQENGADETPASRVRLQYAIEQYAHAHMLIADGDGEKAERMLARAEADAELALAIANQVRSANAAATALDEVQNVNAK